MQTCMGCGFQRPLIECRGTVQLAESPLSGRDQDVTMHLCQACLHASGAAVKVPVSVQVSHIRPRSR